MCVVIAFVVCPADMLMQDICIVELREPSGWITIPLTAPGQADLQSGTLAAGRPVHAFFYQVGAQPNVFVWIGFHHVYDVPSTTLGAELEGLSQQLPMPFLGVTCEGPCACHQVRLQASLLTSCTSPG
jgi:hypothetical protein